MSKRLIITAEEGPNGVEVQLVEEIIVSEGGEEESDSSGVVGDTALVTATEAESIMLAGIKSAVYLYIDAVIGNLDESSCEVGSDNNPTTNCIEDSEEETISNVTFIPTMLCGDKDDSEDE